MYTGLFWSVFWSALLYVSFVVYMSHLTYMSSGDRPYDDNCHDFCQHISFWGLFLFYTGLFWRSFLSCTGLFWHIRREGIDSASVIFTIFVNRSLLEVVLQMYSSFLTHTYTHTYIHTCTCKYMHMYIYIYVCVCLHMYICINISVARESTSRRQALRYLRSCLRTYHGVDR